MRWNQVLAVGTTAIAIAMLVAAAVADDDRLWPPGALALFGIGLYATNALPGHVSAFLFFVSGMVLSVAPPEVIFAGFQSSALWLVFSGFILGAAIMQTGLGRRIAITLAHLLGGSYVRVLAGVVLAGIIMSFVMPSAMGRIMLIAPVAIALAEELGFEKGSRGYTGVVLAATMGGFFPAFAVLPANIPNMVLAGFADSLYGLPFSYGGYLLAHFPMSGIAKPMVIVAIVAVLFPDTVERNTAPGRMSRMSAEERRLALFLTAAVVLWASDFWHQISPAWVGMAVGLALFLPRFGVLKLSVMERDINYAPFFYVAGVISLGAVVSQSGIADLIGQSLLAKFDLAPGNDAANYGVLAVWTAALGPIVTQPNVPAIMAPLAGVLASATELPLKTVLLVQATGFSTVFLPYQAPVLVVAMQFGGIAVRDMTKCTLTLATITLVLLLPLNYYWWRLLGYLS